MQVVGGENCQFKLEIFQGKVWGRKKKGVWDASKLCGLTENQVGHSPGNGKIHTLVGEKKGWVVFPEGRSGTGSGG